MVEAAAGRRSGTSRRWPSGGGEQQLLHQRLVAVAVASRVAMVTTRSAAGGAGAGASGTGGGGGGGGGGRCLEDFFDCLFGVLRTLGWVAARPQGQPRPVPPRGVVAAASADTRRLASELSGIPGRIAGNGACDVMSLYTLQGKKGVNQDAMIFWEVPLKR